MTKKILALGLSVLFIPLLQGCDDRNVVRGATIGAVVGGSIAAIGDHSYRSRSRYHGDRYNNYYRTRSNYYGITFGSRYRDRDYRRTRSGYYDRIRRGRGSDFRYGRRSIDEGGIQTMAQMEVLQTNANGQSLINEREVKSFSSLFSVHPEVGRVLSDAKNRAALGDLRGLSAIGIEPHNYERLARNQMLPSSAVSTMASTLNIDYDHAVAIADDLRAEFQALRATGQIKL